MNTKFKKTFIGISGVIIGTTIVLGFKNHPKDTQLSDLALKNIEALATGENVKLPCEFDEDDKCTVTFELESGQTSTQKIPQSKNI